MRTPLRSDARQRRERLLDAAAEIFASQGYGAPLDSIAARAEVGQGTLYRNFADREALLAALLDRDLTGMEAALGDVPLAEHPFAMLEIMAETSVVNPAVAEYWTALPEDSPVVQAGEQRFYALAGRGLEAAKAAGRLRGDIGPEDFCIIGLMFRAIRFGADETERRRTKERVLSIVFAGITP